jgi:hypothetical protein
MYDQDVTRVARTLAEADGNDPDALMSGVPPMKVHGREGWYVPSREHTYPVWRSYIGMAREVMNGAPVQQNLFQGAGE